MDNLGNQPDRIEGKSRGIFRKEISQIRDEQKEKFREQQIVSEMQRKLIGEIKMTPSEIRKFYNQLSKDSLPTIPTTVEVQIITFEPKIPFDVTDAIKARLRDFTEQINSGKMEFSTLARLYSEDPASAARGGEMGFMSKTDWCRSLPMWHSTFLIRNVYLRLYRQNTDIISSS